MKKFIFSAVAMMAFSMSSMASNTEIFEVQNEYKYDSLSLIEDCYDQAAAFMDFLYAFSNYTFSDAQNSHNLNVGVAIFCYDQGDISLAYQLHSR